ncbi:hypothetical protein GH714_014782 [Hevea brasiliensis]|uniref:dolichol kinase n=1 Tax=Hevea brasiliensis TaxID=3981 RepID=A0A6A6KVW4_HEVBR|nr:hypothetical protein GH714_014782 [Hevea brasiliensis]
MLAASVCLSSSALSWHSLDNAHSPPHWSWGAKFGLSCIVLSAALFILSGTGKDANNIKTTVGALSWICSCEISGHLLNTFPSCASIGEALLVTTGLVLYFGDMLACTISKASAFTRYFTILPWIKPGSFMLYWVLTFVFSEPVKRLSLCIYWLCVIYASVLRFYNISRSSKIERILLRKYYHLMAVLMFLPAVIFQPKFLDLAFGAALAVFLTHFSLLLGCALPIWMSSGYNDRPLAPFAGILSLGIGDTMASMVGHKYGVLRWSKTGKKTIEGTAAGITSVLAACSVLLPILASTGYIFTQREAKEDLVKEEKRIKLEFEAQRLSKFEKKVSSSVENVQIMAFGQFRSSGAWEEGKGCC